MKKLFILFSFSALTLLFGIPLHALTLRERVEGLEKKAAAGDAEAMYHLSTLYEHGFDSIPCDSIRSRQLLKESAERDYAPAQNYYGFLIYPSDREEGLGWLQKAADNGEMKAVGNLGFLLLEPDSTINPEERESRDRQAAALLSKASDAGIPAATASLADLYREGRGVEKDTLRAESLYLEAVSRNLPDAEKKLMAMNGLRYQSLSPEEALSEGIRASRAGAYTVAFNLYSTAAQKGNDDNASLSEEKRARLHTLLADAYSSAKGTNYNHEAALRHYALGAAGGDPSAQFILAELLEIFPDVLNRNLIEEAQTLDGSISRQDLVSPDYWYARASEGGISSARTAFSRLFEIP